jgi:hypothetical protein
MTDQEFLGALESCTLAERDFDHVAHVRAGYLYLRSGTFGEALARTEAAIRRYAAALGKADRYHDTITVAYLALIRRHLYERGDGGGWAGFAAANPQLLDRELLLRFFPRTQLESALARRVFLLPQAVNRPN